MDRPASLRPPRPTVLPQADAWRGPPRPTPIGTWCLLASLGVGWFLPAGTSPDATAQLQAWIVGFGLFGLMISDLRPGWKNLVRADVVALTSFYALTLAEFLPGGTEYDLMTSPGSHQAAFRIAAVAFAGMAVASHFRVPSHDVPEVVRGTRLTTPFLVTLFFLISGIAYLHILVAVRFNLVQIIEESMAPRFHQSWARGQFGDWKALLYELGLFKSLVPPLGAMLLLRRRELPGAVVALVIAIVGVTFFMAFAGGTRGVLFTQLGAFLGAWLLFAPNLRFRAVVIIAVLFAASFYFASSYMVAFRQIGLANFIKYGIYAQVDEEFFVDYNLNTIGILHDTFPAEHDFLGWEVYRWAAVRPIPRAIWKGKPEGLSVSIEEAAEMEGLTLSCTFAGEAYMAFGILGVLGTAAGLGILFGWWNSRFGSAKTAAQLLVFASGLYPAAITMRSLFSLMVAILPTIGLIVLLRVLRDLSGDQPALPRARPTRAPTGPPFPENRPSPPRAS